MDDPNETMADFLAKPERERLERAIKWGRHFSPSNPPDIRGYWYMEVLVHAAERELAHHKITLD